MIKQVDIQLFIASLHHISAELELLKDEIPSNVFIELDAIENVLKRDYLDKNKILNENKAWSQFK